MTEILRLYRYKNFTTKYSLYSRQSESQQRAIYKNLLGSPKSVDIIAYCIMPTHLHLAIKQLADKGISKYIAKVLNSYTRYFNCVHRRKGPLWEGKFRNIPVDDDDQLLHLTRYIHLNPSSARLTDTPAKWEYSSYSEYTDRKKDDNNIAAYRDLIDISPGDYKKFVNERIEYQQELSRIKSILLENYIG